MACRGEAAWPVAAPWDGPAKSPGTGRDVRCVRSKRSVEMYPAEKLLQ